MSEDIYEFSFNFQGGVLHFMPTSLSALQKCMYTLFLESCLALPIPMSSYDGFYTFWTSWSPTSVRTVYIQNVPINFKIVTAIVLCISCIDLVYADEENGSTSMSENSFEKVIACMFDPRFILN